MVTVLLLLLLLLMWVKMKMMLLLLVLLLLAVVFDRGGVDVIVVVMMMLLMMVVVMKRMVVVVVIVVVIVVVVVVGSGDEMTGGGCGRDRGCGGRRRLDHAETVDTRGAHAERAEVVDVYRGQVDAAIARVEIAGRRGRVVGATTTTADADAAKLAIEHIRLD